MRNELATGAEMVEAVRMKMDLMDFILVVGGRRLWIPVGNFSEVGNELGN